MDKSGRGEYQQEWRETHKAEIKEYQKNYRQKNKKAIKESAAAYLEANKESRIESQKRYREKNRETIRERDKKYRADNKEKINAYQRERRKSGSPMRGNFGPRDEESKKVSGNAAIRSWELRKERNSNLKVCTSPYCEHEGRAQDKSNFHKSVKTKDDLAYVCKDCLVMAHTKFLATKKAADSDEFIICDTRYKIGTHGFVYYYYFGEWIKSTVTKEELLARPRNDDAE